MLTTFAAHESSSQLRNFNELGAQFVEENTRIRNMSASGFPPSLYSIWESTPQHAMKFQFIILGKAFYRSAPAFYRSVREILTGRLKELDDEVRQWQMYKHRVSSEREQRYNKRLTLIFHRGILDDQRAHLVRASLRYPNHSNLRVFWYRLVSETVSRKMFLMVGMKLIHSL